MATKDRTALKNDFANGKYATGEKFADLIDSMKVVQLPVVDPQALGTSLSFIDSISQDADGKITVTKKTVMPMVGSFRFVANDPTAEAALTTYGATYSSAISGVSPSADTTGVILLMNDDDTTPTKTMMIATQSDGNNGYQFVYVGDLDNALPTDVINAIADVNVGSKATLALAIAAVPDSLKKTGLTVTYYDTTASEWVAKQYVGTTTTDWEDESMWEDVSPAKMLKRDDLTVEEPLTFTVDNLHVVKSTGLDVTSSSNYGCFISEVGNYIGKTIKVLGFQAQNSIVGLAFFDESNNIIQDSFVSFAGSTSSSKEYISTVPNGAKYLICTYHLSHNYNDYYCKVLVNQLDELQNQIDEINDDLTVEEPLTFTVDNLHVVKSTGLDVTSSSNFGCFISEVGNCIGKTIKVLGFQAQNSIVGLAFFDESNNIIQDSFVSFAGSTSSSKEYISTVPNGAKYLICTYHLSHNYNDYYCKVIQGTIDYLKKEVKENSEEIRLISMNLKDEQPLDFRYDGEHTVKVTGLDATALSTNYGCFISDVGNYIGYALKFRGFEQQNNVVGFAFFDEDYNIIEGSFVSYSQYGKTTNTAEFGNVVPSGAKYFIATAHNTYNRDNYYCNVILKPVHLDSYNNYHTKSYRVNFSSYDELIAAYDALVMAYPHYVYKSELSADNVPDGITSDGVHKLYEYRFTLPNYNDTQLTNNNRSRGPQINKPKILIAAGVHGYEISAITSVYLLAKDLCEGNISLAALKAGFDIRIIPSVNPYGLDHNRRGNANGVDINRNFPAEGQDWTPSTSRTSSYDYTVNSGYLDDYDESTSMEGYHPGTAGDQLETKLIMAWALANDDAVVFFDTHNSLYADEYGYLGSLTHVGDELKRNCFHSVDKAISYLINYRKLRYPYKPDGASLVTSVFLYSGGETRTQLQGSAGTMGQFRIANHFAGGTIEFCNVINTQSIKIARYSMMIGVIGCEVLGNILMGVVENYNVNEPKTICETSELMNFGLRYTKLVWNKTTNSPMVWNGTEYIELAVKQQET